MTDQPMNRNGSGYIDPTAYMAIKNVRKGEKKMKNNELCTGEIWKIDTAKGERYAIILAVGENASTILTLCENDFLNAVPVICKGTMYTDISRISYVFNDNFIEFARSMTEIEFDNIMDKVVKYLGMSRNIQKDVAEKIVEVPVDNTELFEELTKAKLELEFYKNIADDYKQLAEKMLKYAQGKPIQ